MAETFTAEQVQAILQAQGMTIKDFAKIAKALENGDIEATKPKDSVVTDTTWTLKLVNYPDFVIERKTPKTTQQLVIMMSCGQFYLRNDKTGAAQVLNIESYAKFTAGMSSIYLPNDFWITKIEGGKKFYDNFSIILNNKKYQEMIKYKCVTPYTYVDRWSKPCDAACIAAYEAYPILYKEFYHNDTVRPIICLNKCSLLVDIIENFGLNNARDFLKSWEISLLKGTQERWSRKCNNPFLDCGEGYPTRGYSNHDFDHRHEKYRYSPRPLIPMEYNAFKEYVLYTSVRMGLGLNAATFWRTWNDTIKMQMELYGKIKEKYPKDLQVYHDQLAYMCILHKQEIDAKKFALRSIVTQQYEMNIGEWTFIAPKTPQDFYDEAVSQSNCLASYVDTYADGKDHIVFMRHKATPEESCITIEIRGDQLCQAYRAHNAHVSSGERAVIDRWMEKVKKINANPESLK